MDDLSPNLYPWVIKAPHARTQESIKKELLAALKAAEYYLSSGSKPDAVLFKKIKDAIREAENS